MVSPLPKDSFAGQRGLAHSRFSKQKEKSTNPTNLETEAILGGERGLKLESGFGSAPSLDSPFRSLGPAQSGRTSGLQRTNEQSTGTLRPGHTAFPRPHPSAGLCPTGQRAPESQSRGSQSVTQATGRRGWHVGQPIGGLGESRGVELAFCRHLFPGVF